MSPTFAAPGTVGFCLARGPSFWEYGALIGDAFKRFTGHSSRPPDLVMEFALGWRPDHLLRFLVKLQQVKLPDPALIFLPHSGSLEPVRQGAEVPQSFSAVAIARINRCVAAPQAWICSLRTSRVPAHPRCMCLNCSKALSLHQQYPKFLVVGKAHAG